MEEVKLMGQNYMKWGINKTNFWKRFTILFQRNRNQTCIIKPKLLIGSWEILLTCFGQKVKKQDIYLVCRGCSHEFKALLQHGPASKPIKWGRETQTARVVIGWAAGRLPFYLMARWPKQCVRRLSANMFSFFIKYNRNSNFKHYQKRSGYVIFIHILVSTHRHLHKPFTYDPCMITIIPNVKLYKVYLKCYNR